MNQKATVSFHTLGCKLNQAETEAQARQFAAAGYAIAESNANICVLNTCTVTHIADRKSRHLIRLLRKNNPHAFIVVTGCCAETSPDELIRTGANIIVNNNQKNQIPELLKRQPMAAGSSLRHPSVITDNKRVRSFVKIQQGCTNGCAYCIVPSVRGHEHSLPSDDIVREIQIRTADSYKEVVLTGTRVGAYEHHGENLATLLQRILEETGIQRLHLSSLQPADLRPQLLTLWQNSRLCPHFHLALQSGSDSVLKRMRRRYTANEYQETVQHVRNLMPDASVTTDIMVGFPGESDAEFEESYQLCRDMGFAAIHVFMYSPRPVTLAATMDGQIDAKVKKQRSLKMLALARESAARSGSSSSARFTTSGRTK